MLHQVSILNSWACDIMLPPNCMWFLPQTIWWATLHHPVGWYQEQYFYFLSKSEHPYLTHKILRSKISLLQCLISSIWLDFRINQDTSFWVYLWRYFLEWFNLGRRFTLNVDWVQTDSNGKKNKSAQDTPASSLSASWLDCYDQSPPMPFLPQWSSFLPGIAFDGNFIIATKIVANIPLKKATTTKIRNLTDISTSRI